jgi:hypothetical protein
MFGSLTSPKRWRVNILRRIHSLALRACILNGFREHGAVHLDRIMHGASDRIELESSNVFDWPRNKFLWSPNS